MDSADQLTNLPFSQGQCRVWHDLGHYVTRRALGSAVSPYLVSSHGLGGLM